MRLSSSRNKKGVQLFSDLMLMKFKPKNEQGNRLYKNEPSHKRIEEDIKADRKKVLVHQIRFLELASKDAVIIGNYNQLDMINIDGLSHNFVDTFLYWSLNISKPIMSVKINPKRQIMMLSTSKSILLYRYNSVKKQRRQPDLVASFEVQHEVWHIQFATQDNIAIFYQRHFEIYFFSENNQIEKRLSKPYPVDQKMRLLAVPQAADQTINIFFDQSEPKAPTFELRCLEINIFDQNIRVNQHYKIYDIMKTLRKHLKIQNYGKDIVLNLGQEVLVARKGYIVGSVNVNLQTQNGLLKYIPDKKLLVHIETTTMEIYRFQLNTSSTPHRIQLTSIDSIQIKPHHQKWKLRTVLPVLQKNYVLFYEDVKSNKTTQGQIFYSFLLSYTVDISVKINQILDSNKNMADLTPEQLEAKCDILRKMGMKDHEIYLQFWHKSSRSSVRDYQLLLATNDYKIIKQQVQNKMKKMSMSFKEVAKIQETCLQLLKPRVLSEQCNQELLKDYLISALLLRKLKLYKELQVFDKSNELMSTDKPLLINIQDYTNFKNKDIKQFLFQRFNSKMYKNPKLIKITRIILNHFRFTYRYIYKEIMHQVIKISKNDFIQALKAIPQLLPITQKQTNPDGQLEDILYHGVWRPIPDSQWQKNMHLQSLRNIYNKEVVDEFIKSVWFRRNWLTFHHLIPLKKEQIKAINTKTNSVDIFYRVIQSLHHAISDQNVLSQTLSHIENKYELFPQHLKQRLSLYISLYKYYDSYSREAKIASFTLQQFLNFRDFDLFKNFFQLEKVRKNALLRQIREIYVRQVPNGQGRGFFNSSLLNYFKSDISQISNLKHMLNRINNQKKEFHETNEEMYEILVEAMIIKLKVGSSNDIPIDQVLIYVQNIPLNSRNSFIIESLQIIQKISEESDTLKKMRINMSLRDIIDNYQKVIQKMVEYQIKKHEILSLDNPKTIVARTYRLLSEIQSFKEKIYGQNYNQLSFFIFLSKILQHDNKVPIAIDILQDQYLNSYFFIDIPIIQSLVYYMYRWKFSTNDNYVSNSTYVTSILKMLPEDDPVRKFLQNQTKFAVLLSTPRNPVLYPLSSESRFPRITELQNILKYMDKASLAKINIDQIISCMKKMEELEPHMQDKSSIVPPPSILRQKIEEDAVYQVFIAIFAHKNMIRQVLPILRKFYETDKQRASIAVMIVIFQISIELNEASKVLITRICSYLYYKPSQLLNVLDGLLQNKFTGLEATRYFKGIYKKIRDQNLNFKPQGNPAFNEHFEDLKIDAAQEKLRKSKLVKGTLVRLKKSRKVFLHNYMYDFVFLIFCHDPLDAAIFLKYLPQATWKELKSFLLFLVKQIIFDQPRVVQIIQKIFYIVFKNYRENLDIFRLVSQFKRRPLNYKIQLTKSDEMSQYQRKIQSNFQTFNGLNASWNKQTSHQLKRQLTLASKEQALNDSIQNIQIFDQTKLGQAGEEDLKHQSEEPIPNPFFRFFQTEKPVHIAFNPSNERKTFLKRDSMSKIEIRKQSSHRISPMIHRNSVDENEFKIKPLIKDDKGNNQRKYFSNDIRSRHVQSDSRINDFDDKKSATKSQKNEKSPPTSPNIIKIQSNPRVSKDEFVRKDEQINHNQQQLYIAVHDVQIQQRQNQSKAQNNDIKINQPEYQQGLTPSEQLNIDVHDILIRLYATFNSKIQNEEPYNVRKLSIEKQKHPEKWPQIIAEIIRKIYHQPERTYQIAIKLIEQIGHRFSQLGINQNNAQIYYKIATLQSKYGLDLPLHVMLPLDRLYLQKNSEQELFQSLKQSIIANCDDQNIEKVSKMITIGFRKNTYEVKLLVTYIQHIIKNIPQGLAIEAYQNYLRQIKRLVQTMNVKILIIEAQNIVKNINHIDLRTGLVNHIIHLIKKGGFSKEAKELTQKLG